MSRRTLAELSRQLEEQRRAERARVRAEREAQIVNGPRRRLFELDASIMDSVAVSNLPFSEGTITEIQLIADNMHEAYTAHAAQQTDMQSVFQHNLERKRW